MQATPTLFTARAAGLMYLAIIACGVFGELFVRGALVVAGDPAATADRILGAELLWRTGIATDLLMHVLDVPLIVFFYYLLKPVSPTLAMLATVFNVVQTCVLALNKLNLVAALSFLTAPAFAARPEVAQALAFVAIDLHGDGFAIGLVFFGFVCLVRGYLIVRSDLMPKALGALLAVGGLGYLANSFAVLLSPPLAALLFPAVLLPAFVAELAIGAWLLVADQAALERRLARQRPLGATGPGA